MSKKLCKIDTKKKLKEEKAKYECEKCGLYSRKKKKLCRSNKL